MDKTLNQDEANKFQGKNEPKKKLEELSDEELVEREALLNENLEKAIKAANELLAKKEEPLLKEEEVEKTKEPEPQTEPEEKSRQDLDQQKQEVKNYVNTYSEKDIDEKNPEGVKFQKIEVLEEKKKDNKEEMVNKEKELPEGMSSLGKRIETAKDLAMGEQIAWDKSDKKNELEIPEEGEQKMILGELEKEKPPVVEKPIQQMDLQRVITESNKIIEEQEEALGIKFTTEQKQAITQELFFQSKEDFGNKTLESSGVPKSIIDKTKNWLKKVEWKEVGKAGLGALFIGSATIAAGTLLGVAPTSAGGILGKMGMRVGGAMGLNMALTSSLPGKFFKAFARKEGEGQQTGWRKEVGLNAGNIASALGVLGAFLLSGGTVAAIAGGGIVMRKTLNLIFDNQVKKLEEENSEKSMKRAKLLRRAKGVINGAATIGVGVATMAVFHNEDVETQEAQKHQKIEQDIEEQKQTETKNLEELRKKIQEQMGEKIEGKIDFQGVEAEFSSRGAIQTIDDLKEQLNEKYPDMNKAPENVKGFMNTDSAQQAIKFGFFNPSDPGGAESALVWKGSKLEFNNEGDLIFHDVKTGEDNILINEKPEKYEGKMFDSDQSGNKIETEPEIKSETIETHDAEPEIKSEYREVPVNSEEEWASAPENSYKLSLSQSLAVNEAIAQSKEALLSFSTDEKMNLNIQETLERGRADSFIGIKESEIGENYRPLGKLIHKLHEVTHLEPMGPTSQHAAETPQDYIRRAMSKAALEDKLGEIELESNLNEDVNEAVQENGNHNTEIEIPRNENYPSLYGGKINFEYDDSGKPIKYATSGNLIGLFNNPILNEGFGKDVVEYSKEHNIKDPYFETDKVNYQARSLYINLAAYDSIKDNPIYGEESKLLKSIINNEIKYMNTYGNIVNVSNLPEEITNYP